MHAQFARKLQLTAAALGCTTRKALCARFRVANPATVCDIDRLHKWMQGRAMPREQQFFEDWRVVISSQHHATWIETSSIQDFAKELARGAGIPLADLWLRDDLQQRKNTTTPAILGAQRTLFGGFACYSHAWSPRYRGKLVRACLRIEPGPRQGVQATYAEALISGTIRLSGEVMLSGGMMHVLLKESANNLPLFLSLVAPGPPASVLCGILAGPALIAHAALPSATRFVAVRVPDDRVLEATNRYMEAEPPAVSEDLAVAGLCIPEADRATDALLRFLGNGASQVTMAEQLVLCDLLDPAHPDAQGAAAEA